MAGPLEDNGTYRTLSQRLVEISESCYVRKTDWSSCGWRLLSTRQIFRGLLAPDASGNLTGCLPQRRVVDVLSSGQEKLFTRGAGHFWTHHSGRNVLPSAAAALNVEKSDSDMLGGWMAQKSERYNRVAKVRIKVVQNLVGATFADRANSDPLFEADALEEFSLFLQRQGTSQELQAEYLRKLSSRSFAFLPRAIEERTSGADERIDLGVQQREEDEEKEREARGTSTVHPNWVTVPVKHAKPQRISPAKLLYSHELEEKHQDLARIVIVLCDPGH